MLDPISLAFSFLMQHPNVAVSGAKAFAGPKTVNVASMQESFADLSRGILNCYHHTARYQVADIIQKPWNRQDQYGADNSALIKIRYTGLSGSSFEMTVAVLNKEKMIRTAILADTAVVPYNKKCQLEQWSST